MRGLSILAWPLAFAGLIATSKAKKNSTPIADEPPIVEATSGPIPGSTPGPGKFPIDVEFRCVTKAAQSCPDFEIFGDTMKAENIWSTNTEYSQTILFVRSTLDLGNTTGFYVVDGSQLYRYRPSFNWAGAEPWTLTKESADQVLTITVTRSEEAVQPNCKELTPATAAGTSRMRNIVLQPGLLAYSGDTFAINLYNANGELIQKTQTGFITRFAASETVKRVTINRPSRGVSICAKDLIALETAVDFEVVDP